MLTVLPYSLDKDLINEAKKHLDQFLNFKTSLNEKSGDFFYDPWIIKKEFKGTCFEQILNSVDTDIGEARIVALESMRCYTKHADIDDRLHLNLFGDGGYLLDLTNNKVYPLTQDAKWYEMNAGNIHTAVSCGEHIRYQLVVRKLLKQNILTDSISIEIQLEGNNHRFKFDNSVSPWLNYANKNSIINKFAVSNNGCSFDVEKKHLSHLESILPKGIRLVYH